MWKRLICFVRGHRYAKAPYPDNPGEFLLRCRRCGRVKELPEGWLPGTIWS